MAKRTTDVDERSGAGRSCSPGATREIPKGDGDEPVQAYIAAMPGWKRALGARLDGLIVRTVPDVHKAVKWNQPFYGHEGEGWFLVLSLLHELRPAPVLRGTSLDPVPPKASKHDEVGYLDIREGDALDEGSSWTGSDRRATLPGGCSALDREVGRRPARTQRCGRDDHDLDPQVLACPVDGLR